MMMMLMMMMMKGNGSVRQHSKNFHNNRTSFSFFFIGKVELFPILYVQFPSFTNFPPATKERNERKKGSRSEKQASGKSKKKL